MYFSKEKFLKNAEKCTINQVREHFDVLDGLEVVFDEKFDKRYGYIKQYFSNGLEYWLYPISRSWCTENKEPKQLSLF